MASSDSHQHWMYDWIDEFDIETKQDVDSRIKDRRAVSYLQELAEKSFNRTPTWTPKTNAVLAGPGLDISSRATCSTFKCRKNSIDTEMGQLLHFFDSVVMQGPEPWEWKNFPDALRDPRRRDSSLDSLKDYAVTLNYIRDSGLSEYVVFADRRSCFCYNHFQQYASELGMTSLASPTRIEESARELSRAGSVRVEQHGSRVWWGSVTSPLFADSLGMPFFRKTRPKKYEVAEALLVDQLKAVVFDLYAAQKMDLPISSLASRSLFEARSESGQLNIEDVALRIRIPYLQGLSSRQVIELRERLPEDFQIFQSALRESISMTLEKSGDASADKVADIVWNQRLKPAVADIERRINANKSSFALKSAASVTVGLAAAGITSMTTIPWIVGILGTAAMAATIPAAHFTEFVKDRTQTRKDAPMYFLWKASKEHH